MIFGVKFLVITILSLYISITGLQKSNYGLAFFGLLFSCIFGYLSYVFFKKPENFTNDKKNKKNKKIGKYVNFMILRLIIIIIACSRVNYILDYFKNIF